LELRESELEEAAGCIALNGVPVRISESQANRGDDWGNI